jgi:hypothetical protein
VIRIRRESSPLPCFLASTDYKTEPPCYFASIPSLLSRFGRLFKPPHAPPPPYPPPRASRRLPIIPRPYRRAGWVRCELLDLPVFSLLRLVAGAVFWCFPVMAPPWGLAGGRKLAGVRRPLSFSLPDPISAVRFESDGSYLMIPVRVNFCKRDPKLLCYRTRGPKRKPENTFWLNENVIRFGKEKYAFWYLQFCHLICFSRRIFVLTPIWSIQIALDSYLRALCNYTTVQ